MAWNLVPASSMTTSFSCTVSLNSTIFGPSLVACSCGCTNGGATRSTCWRGSLRSSANAGAVASIAAIAAPINAVLRVIIVVLLVLDAATMHRLKRAFFVAAQQNRRTSGPARLDAENCDAVCAKATSIEAKPADWLHEKHRAAEPRTDC